MTIAGEITEYEDSFLQQLILEKDPSVREALRRYSLYFPRRFLTIEERVSRSCSCSTRETTAPTC